MNQVTTQRADDGSSRIVPALGEPVDALLVCVCVMCKQMHLRCSR
jgi:hypothetical protein